MFVVINILANFTLFQNGTGVDYEDLLNQKRRDEARYRQGGQFSTNLRSANSDGFLNRTPYTNTGGFNEELEDLSRAVSVETAVTE